MRLRPTRAPIVFDWWLTGICVSRIFNGLVFMTYAAALPILQQQWAMSATQAGSIAGGFQLGYAVSLVLFSSLADRISARTVYIHSLFASGVCGLAFAFLARDFLSGLILHTVLGFSLGGTYTTGVMIIADQYAPVRRGMAVGFFIASTSCGYALSLIISGIAIPLGGYPLSFLFTCLGPVWAWTPAFLAACLEAAGAAGVKAVAAGANIVALFHLMGLLASFSMGILSDRFGRARVMVMLAAVSMFCSFSFGWTIGSPLVMIVGVGVLYAFSSLGDSPILSAALTEEMEPAYLGAALGLRSLVGFGVAAVAPLAFGAVLDWSNPFINGQRQYHTWGWAFSLLGAGGLGAVWTISRYGNIRGLGRRAQG